MTVSGQEVPVELIEAAQRICEAPDLSVVIDEVLSAVHEVLGFGRVRFYLSLPEYGIIRQESIVGAPGHERDEEVPLLKDHVLGEVVLGDASPVMRRVGSLHDPAQNQSGLPTYFAKMSLPSGDLGVLVADNPNTCQEMSGRELYFLGLLARFSSFPMERAHHEQGRARIASLVSHELRTPLTSVAAFAEMLLDGDAGQLTEKQERFVQRIAKAASQLQKIVQDLLELSRISEESEPIEKTPIALTPFLEDTSQNLLPQANAKQIRLVVEAPASCGTLRTDERRLQQALSNLIDNAIKYSSPHTTVRILARQTDSQTRLSVIDEGPGISVDDQKHIFEEFFRCYPTTAEGLADKGSGLGLPIVRNLAKLLGAGIEVKSELGKGSTFTLVFPTQ